MKKGIPDFLYEKLLNQYGEELTIKIVEGYCKKRPVTLRINTLKTSASKVKEELSRYGYSFKSVNWNENALILCDVTEKDVRQLDMYSNGEIYLQSLSSMMPVIVLAPKEEENILDMAAAPGGKTTQISAITRDKAFITACEKNKIRAERLKYNINKQGSKRTTILMQDAIKLDKYFSFDRILLDAPCSGSGTINIKNEKLEKIFNEGLTTNSAKVQLQLLKKAIEILKPGHEMVYSTCSILKEENEENISKILKMNNVEIVPINKELFTEIPLLPVTIDGTICICPNELYEGFFIAKLKIKG